MQGAHLESLQRLAASEHSELSERTLRTVTMMHLRMSCRCVLLVLPSAGVQGPLQHTLTQLGINITGYAHADGVEVVNNGARVVNWEGVAALRL